MRVIQEIGVKTIYLTDGRTASSWVRELHKGLEKANVPYLKSGLSVGNSGRRISKNALVGFTTNTNSIYASQRGVYFTSTASTSAGGFSVTEGEGWRRAIALYAARKLVEDTWATHNDEYLAPITYRQV